MKTKILIVEDDPHIRFGLEEVLKGEGFLVSTREKGDGAIAAIVEERPIMVLLDIMLPGMSGYDICKEIRTRRLPVLILMLTAKSQEIEKVIGLDLGADDYLTKPFGVRELIARIRALIRRAQPAKAELKPFSIGASFIDPNTHTITRGELRERLTPRELHLLRIFHQSPSQVLSRERLLNEVWGYGYYGTTRTLDQVIVQLRKKLGESGEPKLLLTVHGVGYRLAMAPP